VVTVECGANPYLPFYAFDNTQDMFLLRYDSLTFAAQDRMYTSAYAFVVNSRKFVLRVLCYRM
jgi:hypothetical protein